LFCELYSTDREFFGNGVESYGEAYNLDLSIARHYATARSNAHRLLTNANILARINNLLELGPLNDQSVDRELAFVITQKAELGPKVAAIKEYNAIKGRIIKKLEHTGKDGAPISFLDMSSHDDSSTS
jgi:hypothetical protein